MKINLATAHYVITVRNRDASERGIRSAVLNGTELAVGDSGLIIPMKDGHHQLTVVLGSGNA